jgi:hypothetical protein
VVGRKAGNDLDVFWVQDTGELAALGPARRKHESLTEFVDDLADASPTTVEVLVVESDLDRLRALLDDWEIQQGKRDSYLWLCHHLGLATPT